MVVVNRTHRIFAKHLLDTLTAAGSLLETATLKAMLLDDTTTVDAEWDTKGHTNGIGDFGTLGEHGGATRVTPTGLASALLGSTQAALDLVDVLFPSVTATANAPAHVLFYAEEAGAAADPALTNRWPVALAAVSFTPDGTDYTGVVPLGGLFAAETNP